MAEPIHIGRRLELFVDRHLIRSLHGVSMRLQHPVPAGGVFTFDRPWEGRYCGYITVLPIDGGFRLYYRGNPLDYPDGSEREVTCVAESPDGVVWTRPSLGFFEVDGSRDNNAILAGAAPFSHNFAPFVDTRPDVPESKRFKALAGIKGSGLAAFVSADGLRWNRLREEPVFTQGMFDSQNVAFWSEPEQCYVCYVRIWSEGGYEGIRTVGRTTSDDFAHWTPLEPMDFGGAPLEHLYTNQTHPYFRAPHLYIAVAARFMPGRRVLTAEQFAAIGGEGHYGEDCSDCVLLTSRGGARYDRTFMEAFVRPGIGLENWTSRTNYPVRGLVPSDPATLSLYIQRRYGQPGHYLERFTLRTDGFASLHAPYTGGEVFTHPLTFDGRELVINYATSAAGRVRVEVQRPDGTPAPGFALEDAVECVGDELERVVRWKSGSDLSSLGGVPLALRLEMKDADLYSIRVR